MPRLNALDQATTGYGAYWFDTTRTILQDCAPGVCTIRLSDGTLISPRGDRIHLEARVGRWVSQDAEGVYGSFGFFPGAAIASGPSKVASELIGPDGSLIYKLRYQSAGPWFHTGTGLEIPGDGDSWQNLGGGRYLVRRGMDIVDETGHVIGRGWWPRQHGTHVLYQAETGELVLDGHVVGAAGSYFRPDFLVHADGSIAIVWASTEGETDVVRRELTAAQLVVLPLYHATPIPVPVDPPLEPPSMFTPIRLPDAAQAIVVALYLRSKGLAHGDDDQRRQLAKLIAEQVRFALGSAWGWKSAGGARPPSKDTIAMREGATLHGFDLFNGSTREPNDHPMSLDITGQDFIEVLPIDHLGGQPVPGDPPPVIVDPPPVVKPPTPPTPPADTLDARVAALEALIGEMALEIEADFANDESRLDQIDARLKSLPAAVDLSLYAKHGDPVEVSGKVAFFGVNKWGGTIK